MLTLTEEIRALLLKYQPDALRTALRTEYRTDLLIRACGLAGEWGEYLASLPNNTARGEELADCFWYAASLAELVGAQIGDFVQVTSFGPVDQRNLTISIAACCEYAKKVGGHGRDKPVEDLIKHLRNVVNGLIVESTLLASISDEYTLPNLLAANVAKLRARHANAGPGGFDPNYGKPTLDTAAFFNKPIEEVDPAKRIAERGEPAMPFGVALEDSKPVPGTDLHEVSISTGRMSFDEAARASGLTERQITNLHAHGTGHDVPPPLTGEQLDAEPNRALALFEHAAAVSPEPVRDDLAAREEIANDTTREHE